MMHGLIRKRIEATPGWRSDQWGTPINQADMIVTSLAFSYVFLAGHRALGFRFSRDEVRAYLHLWRYVGYLMGIDDAQLPSTEEEAARMLVLALTLQAPPDDDSRALAAAFRASRQESPTDGAFDRAATWLDERMGTGFARLMLGRTAAGELNIPTTPWMAWPLVFAPANFALETARSRVPGAHRLAVRLGGYAQRRTVAAMLDGDEPSYVPGVELTARAQGCPFAGA
jgi:hypothetical protein